MEGASGNGAQRYTGVRLDKRLPLTLTLSP